MSFRDPFPFLLVSPGDDDGRTLRRELVGNAESDARIAASSIPIRHGDSH
jgi:hypothetical protein